MPRRIIKSTFVEALFDRVREMLCEEGKNLTFPEINSPLRMEAVAENIAKPLIKYQTEETGEFKYPDLIHDDMERQNILSVNNRITGLVDLDSIRSGDILYEFGHFLFNFVLCDPDANLSMIALYIDELAKAGIIEQKDIPLLYRYIFQFVVSDVIEFEELSSKRTQSQHSKINLPLLVQQYDKALALAKEFFRIEFAL